MKTLLVHIGYPKTATSSIQLNLLADLHRSGEIEYLNHLNKEVDFMGSFYCKNILHYIMSGKYSAGFDLEIEKLRHLNASLSVISNENISFFCEDFSWAYSSGRAVENVQRLKEVFEDLFDEVKIVMTLRNQLTMIPSFYTQQYFSIIGEEPKFKNYETWIKSNFGKDIPSNKLIFNYLEMYRAYTRFFNIDDIHVLLFEDFKNDKEVIYTRLSILLGVSLNYVYDIMESRSQNISKKGKGTLYVDSPTLEKVIKNKIKQTFKKVLSEDKIVLIGRFFKKMIPIAMLNKQVDAQVEIRGLTPEEITYIQNRYSESNQSLMQEAGLDETKLLEYGYIA